jgi:SAM-dependent methyltransferase
MARKPEFYSAEHASAFQFPGVAVSYATRPAYPPALFTRLLELIVDDPRAVLDLGCGTGFLARGLAPRVLRVDALDISTAMLDEGRRQPGGEAANIRWLLGTAETGPLDPPYGLVVGGASLHWMEWAVVLPRLAFVLTPHGSMAIVDIYTVPPPWWTELLPILRRYSTNPALRLDWDWITYLHEQGLLDIRERARMDPVPFVQSLDDYVESFHAHESLTRERLGPSRANAFDAEVRALVSPHAGAEVKLTTHVDLTIGRPMSPGDPHALD